MIVYILLIRDNKIYKTKLIQKIKYFLSHLQINFILE